MKPAPRPTTETSGFWAACAEGRLTAQSCQDCGRHQFPPRALCFGCHSARLVPIEIAPEGSVYSFTVVHRPPNRFFSDAVPYVLALIAFADGVRMMMNVVDCDPETVEIGMPIRVVFEHRGDPPQFLPQAQPLLQTRQV